MKIGMILMGASSTCSTSLAAEAVFHDLIRRGLDPSTIQLGIMDGLPGLEGAFPELEWMHLRTTNLIERHPPREKIFLNVEVSFHSDR